MSEPSNVIPFGPVLDKNEKLSQLRDQLKFGGGDGTSGGMEARIAVLEAHMEHVREGLDRLSGLPADVASIKATVTGLPTKDYVAEKLRNHTLMICTITGLFVTISTLILKFAGE